jgi:hypothetical protein
VYASALADAGEELDGRVAAAAEMAVAKVSVHAAAIVLARERLVDMNEGRGIRRAKREPLIARAGRDQLSTSDATIRALGEARQASARGLDAGSGRQGCSGSRDLTGEVLSGNDGTQQSFAADTSRRLPRQRGASSRQDARNTALIRETCYPTVTFVSCATVSEF